VDGKNQEQEISSMPGIARRSLDKLVPHLENCVKLKIPAVAIFPSIDSSKKSLHGDEALNEHGLVPEAIRVIKKNFPELGIITDVALDPYTTHGQDGILSDEGLIKNDETVAQLVKQALTHAGSGADVVAPSDMMDGRVGAIRTALEKNGFHDTVILSYAAKYASSFYGPFRDAVGSAASLGKSTKDSYQMDPANWREALREVALDMSEGADIVMVKPGIMYLDIIQRLSVECPLPIFAYNVSGEYAMIKAAAERGWLDERKTCLELLLSFKRAGASGILTYHALDAARWLQE
jgi:porphobilinogen synthase